MNGAISKKRRCWREAEAKIPALHTLARAFSEALGLAAKGPQVEKLVSSWVAAYQAASRESLLE